MRNSSDTPIEPDMFAVLLAVLAGVLYWTPGDAKIVLAICLIGAIMAFAM